MKLIFGEHIKLLFFLNYYDDQHWEYEYKLKCNKYCKTYIIKYLM